MPIEFNHTIVAAHDKRESAEFVSELFGLPSPKPFGHFLAVALEHGATLDYAEVADGRGDRAAALRVSGVRGRLRRDLRQDLLARPAALGRSGRPAARRVQHQRRRSRRLLPRPRRPLSGDPDPALRLGQLAGAALAYGARGGGFPGRGSRRPAGRRVRAVPRRRRQPGWSVPAPSACWPAAPARHRSAPRSARSRADRPARCRGRWPAGRRCSAARRQC